MLSLRLRVPKYSMLEIAEANYDCCDVVERASEQGVFKNVLNAHSAHFMDVLCLALDGRMILVVVGSPPHALHCITVGHLVEDSIAAKHNEVMLSFYLEGFHVWIVDYDVWVAVKSQNFCLRVSKSPRHRQPTG